MNNIYITHEPHILINQCIQIFDQKKFSLHELLDHVHTLNYYYKVVGLMLILNPTIAIWINCDNILNEYFCDFYRNQVIMNKLIMFKKNNLKLKVLDNLLKKFDTTEQKYKELSNKYISEIRNNLQTQNKTNYYYLQKNTNDPKQRILLEKEYFKISSSCLNQLSNLIILRNDYAIKKQYVNYFCF